MAVISTGATIRHPNVSKPKRVLETKDLEELLDSRGRAGALVLWLSCGAQIDVWELFSDNSHLSAIFDRQGLLIAPTDLRTKKAESFSPQLLQGFWFELKKTTEIFVMSPTVTKNSKQKEVTWQQYRLCLAVAEHQILDGKHFFIW